MKYFLCINLFLILFSSCCVTRDYKKSDNRLIERNQIANILDTQTPSVYNMQFDMKKTHLSGMLIVKQTAPDSHRVMLTSHFGLTILDFELTRDSMIVHYCIEPLQRKSLIHLLENDFNLLLLKGDSPVKVYANKTNPDDQTILIVHKKGWSKTTVSCQDYKNTLPNRIIVKHSLFGITITLEKLEQ